MWAIQQSTPIIDRWEPMECQMRGEYKSHFLCAYVYMRINFVPNSTRKLIRVEPSRNDPLVSCYKSYVQIFMCHNPLRCFNVAGKWMRIASTRHTKSLRKWNTGECERGKILSILSVFHEISF